MEKLSSILAPSARVKAVDLTDSHPVRPGTPTYGRPVGANVLKDRLTLSQRAKDVAFDETLAKVDPTESRGAKIADNAYKKFFEQKMATEEFKTRPASEQTQERSMEIEESAPEEMDRSLESSIKENANANALSSQKEHLDI